MSMQIHEFAWEGSAVGPLSSKSAMHGAAERLRIAFVLDSIDSWQAGGTEQQTAKFISALDPALFAVELYLLRPPAGMAPGDFPCPVHVASSTGPVGGARIKTLTGLIRLFRQQRPHIVQTFLRDGTYYGVTAAKLARVPVVVIARRNLGHWKTFVDRMALKVVNRMVDAWQCNSRAVAESLECEEGVPPDRIETLPNAIDLARFSPATAEERAHAREQLGLQRAEPVFVSVANLTPVKDPLTLVEAAGLVRGAFPQAQFVMIGEGPLRGALEDRIRMLGLSNVRLDGAQRDVRPYLAAADVGLMTSRSEGSSNAVLEYMAMGVPAALSDIPANRELVPGTFFQVGNAAALAERIIKLWKCPELRKSLSGSYRSRAMEYGEEKFARHAQSFYLQLVGE